MTFDERFPARQQHSWRTTMVGYRPNEVMSAQVCCECGQLVAFTHRHRHSDWHDHLAQRLKRLERWRAVAR